jgi:hypothetical protein
VGASILILTELRAQVVQALKEAELKAIEYTEKITPPCALVLPAERYVIPNQEGNTFGEWTVGIRVLLVAPKGTPAFMANKIDEMIGKAVFALAQQEVNVTNVSAPYTLEFFGNEYFGSVIEIEIYISNFEEGER